MNKFKLVTVFLLTLLSCYSFAAEYNGKDIDGNLYSCTVFSYEAGNYYYLQCEFDGDDAIIHFDNGGFIYVAIDGDIDDPSSISGFHYEKANYWDLDVDID